MKNTTFPLSTLILHIQTKTKLSVIFQVDIFGRDNQGQISEVEQNSDLRNTLTYPVTLVTNVRSISIQHDSNNKGTFTYYMTYNLSMSYTLYRK